jgi:Txe/YoeB family toxin of toxin-antitoxin system
MVSWMLYFTNQAQKDAKNISRSGLRPKVEDLLALLEKDPFQNPPAYEKLMGDLEGAYSRRTHIQHRLVYQVLKKENTIKVLRMWTHYD